MVFSLKVISEVLIGDESCNFAQLPTKDDLFLRFFVNLK
jgi:hypothetical protein